VSDVRGALIVNILSEYLALWDLLVFKTLMQFANSAKSAYEALFIGAIKFRPWERIWGSWDPGKSKF
jgi:hypothetical protein